MTTDDIVQRIIRHRLEFELRNSRKEHKELKVVKSLQNDNVKEHGKQNGDYEHKNNSTEVHQ